MRQDGIVNTLPRTIIRSPDGGWTEGSTAPLVLAAARYAAQRRQVRRWIVVCVVALIVGAAGSYSLEIFYPGLWAYNGSERDYLAISISLLAPLFIPMILWLLFVYPFRRLPRLDAVSYSATVTGLHTATIGRDPDGPSGPPIPHHLLVEFQLEVEPGDAAQRVLLADVIAAQDLGRFSPGTSWQVRIFEKRRGRVLLAADHDDVLRVGRDLDTVRRGIDVTTVRSSTKTNADAAGPGSELLPWCRR